MKNERARVIKLRHLISEVQYLFENHEDIKENLQSLFQRYIEHEKTTKEEISEMNKFVNQLTESIEGIEGEYKRQTEDGAYCFYTIKGAVEEQNDDEAKAEFKKFIIEKNKVDWPIMPYQWSGDVSICENRLDERFPGFQNKVNSEMIKEIQSELSNL